MQGEKKRIFGIPEVSAAVWLGGITAAFFFLLAKSSFAISLSDSFQSWTIEGVAPEPSHLLPMDPGSFSFIGTPPAPPANLCALIKCGLDLRFGPEEPKSKSEAH